MPAGCGLYNWKTLLHYVGDGGVPEEKSFLIISNMLHSPENPCRETKVMEGVFPSDILVFV